MTDIVPVPNWGGVRQLETNEYATGGLNGNMNEQAKSLAGQNMYSRLYAGLPFDPVFTAKVGGFPIGGKAALESGDIVRSTVANNTVDPNADMTGWKKTNLASEIFDLNGKSQQEINDTLSVNVKSFGATGKGLVDDIVAIKSALAFMQTFTNGGNLHFPAGIYNISEPIKITKTGITISGDGLAGAINFTTKTFSGSHILYTANDGQAIVQFGNDSALLYIETVKNIKIGSAPTVTTKPLAALQFNAISEFYLDNVSLTGCTYNLDINSCNIGYVNNYVLASGDYNVRMRADSTVYTSGANASLFFSKGNMWKADKSHIRITASTASILSFSESWAEYAQRVFDIEQTSDVSMSVTVKLDKFSASTSAGFAPIDPTYNIANNRFLKAKAFQGGVNGLRVRIDGTDLIAFMQSANHLFEYEKGTNTSANSYMDESILINPILYGVQLSVFKSDTVSSSASLIGKVVANKGYANGVAVPLSDGNTSVGLLKSTIGAFDMREGKPFYLPQQSPSNINTAGQLYFDTVVNRPVYTSQFSAIRLPKPLLTTLNDADLIATLDGTGETIVLVNPLTANRVITLPTVGKYNGAKMRVVRQVGSTGAFTVNVGSLKNLSTGQWCDVECNSALNWVLTAFGSL